MNKKRIGAIVLAGTMVLSLTGCGGNSKAKAYSKYVELGDYKGIEYTKTVQEVTNDDIQSKVDSFLEGLAETEEITNRAIKDGDIVNIDYVGTKDGEAFDGGSDEGFDLTIGSGRFIEGFEEGLIGHKAGEEVSLDLKFPDDYMSEELAGQEVNFAVTINSISVKTTPKLTDELVKKNTDYDTVSAYKDSIEEDLKNQNEESAEQASQRDIFNKVVDNCKVTGYDEAEVKDLVDKEFENFKQTASSYESMGYSYEDVLSMYGYTSEDELKTGITEYIKNYLNQKMILYCIADKEGIKAPGDEVEKMEEEYMTQSGVKTKEELYEYYGDDYFELAILSEKVMDFLKNNAVLVDSTEETSEDVTEQEDAAGTEKTSQEETTETESASEDASTEKTEE